MSGERVSHGKGLRREAGVPRTLTDSLVYARALESLREKISMGSGVMEAMLYARSGGRNRSHRKSAPKGARSVAFT